jgi:hypothetical protein
MSRVGRRLSAAAGASFGGGGQPPSGDSAGAAVHDLILTRIERALPTRQRYKYVQPRVVPEGRGWKVLSPNCSRNIDPQGGEIEIAWLLPVEDHDGAGGWLLFARLHAESRWDLRLRSARLTELLDRLCADPQREFWQ